MRILVVCLFAGIFLGAYGYSFAQTKATVIKGKVATENQVAANLATVLLLSADSAIIRSTTSDVTGTFKFEGLDTGKYLVLISKLGYVQSLTGPYTSTGSNEFNLDIKLIRSLPQLKEVAITATRPYIEVKPGKVLLNVQSSSIAQGNSIFDILRQAPGVKVDNQGNVSIIGRQNALVMLDGKPVNLTPENQADFLQALQSSTVQQIELITNPSSKYEAAGAGIINIISKKGTNVGTNGTLSIGAGYGAFYKSNIGLTFNNRTDKFNVYGSYSYIDDKTFHTILTDRQINYNGLTSDYNSNYYATQQKHNNNFRFGTDYYITPKQTLGVIVYGTVTDNDFIKSNNLKIANKGISDSLITTSSTVKRNVSNLNYDVNYNGVLDDAGKTLSADVLYNNFDRQSSEYITNNFYTAAGNTYRQPLLQQNLSPSSIDNYVAKVDYVNPISKTARIEAGLKYSNVKSDNNLVFGPLVNGQYQNDPRFTNTFNYTENVNSAYVTYANNVGKVNITGGLRVEQTNTKGNSLTAMQVKNQNYLDLFPYVQFIYHPDAKNDFMLSYYRGITRPSFTDINPFLYYVDVYDYRSGNPDLLPQYTNSLELSHTYAKTFTTTLYGKITTGFSGFNNYEQNDATKVDVTTTANFGNFYVAGIRFSAPVQFTGWWQSNFYVDASYQRIVAYAVNGNLNKGTQDVEPSTLQRFTLSSTLIAEISAKYNSPTFYGIGQFKSSYNADASISKQLLNKRASLKLGISDIFNSMYDRAHSTYQNLNLYIVDRVEPRVVRLNFTYKFGKTSVKGIKHQTANEEEQKRVGP